MVAASDNKFPKVILEEVATDGSATVTPVADHRALFLGEDGGLHLKDSAAAVTDVGGGGGGWELTVDEDGSSFAPFTSAAGTWASDGTLIQQTNTTGATTQRARLTAIVPLGAGFVYQGDIRMPSAGQVAGDNLAGLYVGPIGGDGLALMLDEGSGVDVERDASALIRTLTATIVLDTWYTLRFVCASRYVSVYLDGTLLGTNLNPATENTSDYIGMRTYNAIADYRNLKVWTLTLP